MACLADRDAGARRLSRVFGLTLGGANLSTLADARRAFAEEFRLALLAPQDAPLALEAYFESVAIGPLTGKLVLGLAAPVQEIEAMRERAARPTTWTLACASSASAMRIANAPSACRSPGFPSFPRQPRRRNHPAAAHLPSASRQDETLEHFLYPARGLDVVLDARAKERAAVRRTGGLPDSRTPLGR